MADRAGQRTCGCYSAAESESTAKSAIGNTLLSRPTQLRPRPLAQVTPEVTDGHIAQADVRPSGNSESALRVQRARKQCWRDYICSCSPHDLPILSLVLAPCAHDNTWTLALRQNKRRRPRHLLGASQRRVLYRPHLDRHRSTDRRPPLPASWSLAETLVVLFFGWKKASAERTRPKKAD